MNNYAKKLQLLKRFLGDDKLRPEFYNPGLNEIGKDKNRIYATDGHILYGFDFDYSNDDFIKAFDKTQIELSHKFLNSCWKIEQEAIKKKNIEIVIDALKLEIALLKIPKVPLYPKCDLCDGYGNCECDCGTEHECGWCENGYLVNERPIGKQYKSLHYVRMGYRQVIFDPKYLDKIVLVSKELNANILWFASSENDVNYFRIADTAIVLAPVRKEGQPTIYRLAV